MTVSSVLSPLVRPFREDTNVDFCYAPTRLGPCCRDSTEDGADHQLEDDLRHAFRAAGYAQLRHVGIAHDNGRVELQGQVPTYFLKQFAQSLASSVDGVQLVVNNIEVVCPR